jgi:hypothetical protein
MLLNILVVQALPNDLSTKHKLAQELSIEAALLGFLYDIPQAE